jgi:hypothetical protein
MKKTNSGPEGEKDDFLEVIGSGIKNLVANVYDRGVEQYFNVLKMKNELEWKVLSKLMGREWLRKRVGRPAEGGEWNVLDVQRVSGEVFIRVASGQCIGGESYERFMRRERLPASPYLPHVLTAMNIKVNPNNGFDTGSFVIMLSEDEFMESFLFGSPGDVLHDWVENMIVDIITRD